MDVPNEVYGRFKVTIWRRPCAISGSQAVMTVWNLDDRALFGYMYGIVEVVQNGTAFLLDRLVVDATVDPDGDFMMIERTGGKPVSGLIQPVWNEGFDPNQAFEFRYKRDILLMDYSVTGKLDIPAFDPSAYGGGPATFAIVPGITGDWYNPAQGGHGFAVQVLAGNRIHAQWYVFDAAGKPYWIIADGPYTGNKASLQAYNSQGAGAFFPPNFDKSQVGVKAWGTLELQFDTCNTGTVVWSSTVPGFGAGSMPIKRLTMLAGLTCP
ncbi:MAG TPA: hypothetical protein VFN09_06705 [Rhodanobacteraceae bacterium]|nr:hypothetical protein [Rhodanobacteraceae bacterium]